MKFIEGQVEWVNVVNESSLIIFILWVYFQIVTFVLFY